MSKLATKDDLQEMYSRMLPYLGGQADAGFTPVGTIISVMGVNAPENYLKCDGTVYNIADYPELADYFYNQFGSKSKFGGNGTTTFAVPDLRGEFLRGSGTNSHTNQGNGANVGVHQDATTSPYFIYYNADNKIYMSGKSVGAQPVNEDKLIGNASTTGRALYNSSSTDTYKDPDNRVSYSSRPTNTSVLYCIATKNIYLDPSQDYSTSEKVVGHWLDGKTIYQRTFQVTTPATIGTRESHSIGASVDTAVDCKVIFYNQYGSYYHGTFYATDKVIQGETGGAGIKFYILSNVNPTSPNVFEIYVTQSSWCDLPCYVTIQYTKTS